MSENYQSHYDGKLMDPEDVRKCRPLKGCLNPLKKSIKFGGLSLENIPPTWSIETMEEISEDGDKISSIYLKSNEARIQEVDLHVRCDINTSGFARAYDFHKKFLGDPSGDDSAMELIQLKSYSAWGVRFHAPTANMFHAFICCDIAREGNRVTMLIMNLRAIVEDDIDFLINFISENFSSDYKKGDLKQVIIDNPL